MKAFLKRYPLFSYFSLAYFIAWGGILLVNFYSGFKLFHGESVLSKGMSGQIMILWLIMISAPCFAGLLLKRIVDGKEGFKALLSSMGRWKVSIGWYGAALFLVPVLLMAITYCFVLISKNYTPGLLFVTGIGAGFIGGFLEEVGWTGFALPKLLSKYTPIVAGIFLGIIHTGWHLLADYLGAIGFYKSLYLFHFLLWIIALTAFRLLALWIYNHCKSLLLVQLAHASFTGSQLVLGPPEATAPQSVLWYSVFAVALCIIVSIIIMTDRKMFFQKILLNHS